MDPRENPMNASYSQEMYLKYKAITPIIRDQQPPLWGEYITFPSFPNSDHLSALRGTERLQMDYAQTVVNKDIQIMNMQQEIKALKMKLGLYEPQENSVDEVSRCEKNLKNYLYQLAQQKHNLINFAHNYNPNQQSWNTEYFTLPGQHNQFINSPSSNRGVVILEPNERVIGSLVAPHNKGKEIFVDSNFKGKGKLVDPSYALEEAMIWSNSMVGPNQQQEEELATNIMKQKNKDLLRKRAFEEFINFVPSSSYVNSLNNVNLNNSVYDPTDSKRMVRCQSEYAPVTENMPNGLAIASTSTIAVTANRAITTKNVKPIEEQKAIIENPCPAWNDGFELAEHLNKKTDMETVFIDSVP